MNDPKTDATHSRSSLPWPGPAIVDACFVQSSTGQLLALTEDGALFGVDLASGARTRRCSLELPDLARGDVHEHFGVHRYRLHASADGEYAAIVVDYGIEGVTVRCATGQVTMRLNGGSYHNETVPFSACFVRHNGRNALIHRTAWNRLEASDPATGKLLTERHIAPYERGKRPEHYLDYFHGRLVPSPNGARLFDDGWVWQPAAVPCAWSITDWLGTNPYESEDGASLVRITTRDDWNMPSCWLDDRHIALWGLADWNDDEFEETGQAPGVRISSVTEGHDPPARKIPMDTKDPVRNLFSDGQRLFVATKTGTSVWDIATGTPCAHFDGFTAHLHDRASGRLVSLAPDAIGVLTPMDSRFRA